MWKAIKILSWNHVLGCIVTGDVFLRMAAWWHHALRCCWSIRSQRYLTKNPGLVLIRGTGNRAFLYGTAPTLILWLHASFSPHRPPFSAQRTAVVLLRSCQSKLATLTVRSGEELYGGCAPFVALLFRKERIRGKVCSVLWRRRKEKEQKHLSTPPGTRRRRKLSKEKKTKKKNKPASQGRTTCKWGKVFYEVQLSFLQVQQETDCTWT